MTEPAFAVVGHPNKGKSSIVATLAQDESVRIAPSPGTTIETRRYPMRVDGRTLYTLIDTPGFQRARAALDWMKRHETTAAEHADAAARFVQQFASDEKHHDEVELLRPIVEGAAILYVVDGSTPYGSEYEPEMEILRWTGRPSMALINPIGEASHIDEWRSALGQYFSIVRVFDAWTGEFDKRLELLRAFGQLDESWRDSMEEAVDHLAAQRRRQNTQAARAIAEMIVEMLSRREVKTLSVAADLKPHEPALQQRYFDALRAREKRGRVAVEHIYQHDHLQRDESDFEPLERDLFSQRTWVLFGLSRAQLVTAGAVGGALGGLVIDGALGGMTLGSGTLFGAVGGAVAAIGAAAGADKLAHVKLGPVTAGGKTLQCGPVRGANFPFVILNRALLHHRLVAGRTHARRDVLRVDTPADDALTSEQRKTLAKLFTRVRKADRDADALGDVTDELAVEIEAFFHVNRPDADSARRD